MEYDYILAGTDVFPYGATQVTNTVTINSSEAGPEQDAVVLSVAVCFDFNDNKVVDVHDVAQVAARWRLTAAIPDPDLDATTPNYEPRFDTDGDGVITVRDIMAVADRVGVYQNCP